MQIFFIYQSGIVTDLEATKYINEAHHFIATGQYTTNNYLFYSVQILLIAFCLKLHIGFWFVVLIQIIFNGISVICFYKIVEKISNYKWLPFLCTLYFLSLFYYHLFNTFLFTESLFFSISIIYTYVLFSIKELKFKSVSIILLFLGLLYFTRPTGIFFIPATYFYLIIRFFPNKAFLVIAVSGIIGIFGLFFLLNYSLGSGGELDFLLPYIDERIICGVPTIVIPHQFAVPVEKNSVQGLFYIITHYPDLFFRLAFKRLSAFFGVMRSYYSFSHNLIVAVYFYFTYFIILFNIRNLFGTNKPQVWFLLTNIILVTVTVMLSCDEWSNRFIFSVTPFLLLLAVSGINNKIQKINAGNSAGRNK
ncbi:MAG: hypothetical protein ABI784_04070 [Ginsengibacter sp.]